MTIYIRNWRGKLKPSIDNIHTIRIIHQYLAYSRIWQLIITPMHIILGARYGYTSQDVWDFIYRHMQYWLRRN